MGDHRVSLKIEMTGHDITKKMDVWWNWSPGQYDDVDDRALEWLAAAWREMRAKYDREMWEDEAEQREMAIRKSELGELARLKAKYES